MLREPTWLKYGEVTTSANRCHVQGCHTDGHAVERGSGRRIRLASVIVLTQDGLNRFLCK
jgi:hypothetical protein